MMTSSSRISRRTCSVSSSDFKLRPWTSPTLDRSRFEVAVTAESTGETVELKSSLFKTLELGSLFGLWNLFNIYNKQVLKVFSYLTTFIGMRFGRVILPHRRSY